MAVTTNPLDALLFYRNGYTSCRWNFSEAEGTRSHGAGVGEAVRITYSFPTTKPGYAAETGFIPFNAAAKAAAREALEAIETVCNIDFVEVKGVGDITFAYASMSQMGGAAGYAHLPYANYYLDADGRIQDVNYSGSAGDIWIDRGMATAPGDFWQVGHQDLLMHELGHALGLKHPFGDGDVLPTALDHGANTVMSYTPAPYGVVYDYDGATVDARYIRASTPMLMDIKALQFLYGANTSGNGGNTVYQWQKNEELLETIWDGNGIDIIDCSNQVLSCLINLKPGSFSSITLRRTDAEILQAMDTPSNWGVTEEAYRGENNLAIAYGTIIENATGGSGADRIIGNTANNKLAGGGGNDVLTGGAGKDRLSGGAGNDIFDFNSKADLGALATRSDRVLDFVGGMDRLDLAGVDANEAKAGNQAFTFIGSRNFSANASAQVRFSDGVLYGSTDADRDAEFAINLAGLGSLAAADIIL